MNRLGYDLHSRILSSLASVLADPKANSTQEEVERLVSKCPQVSIIPLENTEIISTLEESRQVCMTYRCQNALDALAKYVVHACERIQIELLPLLLSYLKTLPSFRWDSILLSNGPTPPDSATFSLVSGLLCIADKHSDYSDIIYETLWNYGRYTIQLMETCSKEYIIYFILPSLAGLARALQVSPFLYRPCHLQALCDNIQPLIVDQTLETINHAIDVCLRERDVNDYSRQVLGHYWESGIPLSSNRIIHDLLVILRNVIARVITAAKPGEDDQEMNTLAFQPGTLHLTSSIESAWTQLMKKTAHTIQSLNRSEGEQNLRIEKTLRGIYVMSLGYFDDIKKYAERRETEGKTWSRDSYMNEIMGTSLQVAALASVYMHEVDDILTNYINECLFKGPSLSNACIYNASFDAAALLAINFPNLSNNMISIFCRFLATPSLAPDKPTTNSKEETSIQKFTITRLAQCVQTLNPDHRFKVAMSTMYSLLNGIPRYAETDSAEHIQSNANNQTNSEQLSESQREEICISALSAIVGVAVYLQDEEISRQACSMLASRRKSLSYIASATLTRKLVDLAIVSPSSVFRDIINLFSALNHDYLLMDNKQLTYGVINAQLILAQKIEARPELYETYLHNLLTLFVENANTVQRMITRNKKESEMPWLSKLGKLLPVIRALLEHDNFNPHLSPSEDITTLYRNMWFHCVLFGFVTESIWIREWYDSMLYIAQKTPVLVIESATDYLESDLEYNTMLRGGNMADRDISLMRQKLTTYLPSMAYDAKNYSFAQVVFALAVYHVEMMRSKMGDCSFILRYFMNDGLTNSTMANCLETITDRVITTYIRDASQKAASQALDDELRTQMRNILQLCCHRLAKVHALAIKLSDRIVSNFPQVFVDKHLVTLLLELVQLLWRSCEAEYREEYSPIFHFTSERINVTIEIGDSFAYRKDICSHVYENAKRWLLTSTDRCPMEMSGLLHDYLVEYERYGSGENSDITHLGRTLALEVGKAATKNEIPVNFVPKIRNVHLDSSSAFIDGVSTRRYYTGEVKGLDYVASLSDDREEKQQGSTLFEQVPIMLSTLDSLLQETKDQHKKIPIDRLRRTMLQAASFVVLLPSVHPDLIHYLVSIPVRIFTPESIEIGIDVWSWLLIERPDIEECLMIEIANMWTWAQRHRKGLFCPMINAKHPFMGTMTYTPSDKSIIDKNNRAVTLLFAPHVAWIKFLTGRFYALRHRSKQLTRIFISLLSDTFRNSHLMSTHPFARQPRFRLLYLGIKVLQSTQMEALSECQFRDLVYSSAFDWFSSPPKWHYGSRKSFALAEHKALTDFYHILTNDTPRLVDLLTSVTSSPNNKGTKTPEYYTLFKNKTKEDILREHKLAKRLLLLLMDNELSRLSVWCNPLNAVGPGYIANYSGNIEKSITTDEGWKDIVRFAWQISPKVAVQMAARFAQPAVQRELHILIANNTMDVIDVPEALEILLGEKDGLDENIFKNDNEYNDEENTTITLWQSAIFKVGDDCRQDVLALQLIAVFKNIFTSVGLDLYVFPYRVVATAPGRGVIDVIPRSISRDQLGREKVNSMYDYFVAKYGGPSTIAFQRARTNFVQSAAAYSLISYLLQIKDRHNGNIMLDDDGHLVHIDFGFIFDIAPGGITFESSPFKLTTEMVQLMGGSSEQQAFKHFSELVIKGYLACRPYADQIMHLVTLMLQSGLPCFKGDTIKRMRYRFQTDKSDRAAADFMIQRIKDSFENQRTVLYDYFQKITNGIPY
ncbi:Putative Phosphatidylinositol 4-kinase stt4 [Rhizopus microsporus]|nr:Putative Phosphatidylinositol 4-kinase stt4 [Rhizopus microsporus]